MPDNLFRSHSLEKSSNEGKVLTSGAITLWEDQPVSPLDVGDTFQPVPNGPILTVDRVNINDNVIGINAGKPVRQWQISIEGSDKLEADSSERHSFSIEQDNDNLIHSGSVSKSVTGDTPPLSISVAREIIVAGNLRADDLTNARNEELRSNAKSKSWRIALIDDLHRARMLVVDGEGILSVVRRIVRRL